MIIGPLDPVSPGQILRITVNVAGFAPSDADVASALSERFNVLSVRRSLFSSEYQITIRHTGDTIEPAGNIGSDLAAFLDAKFFSIIDADAVKYERLSAFSGDGGSGGPSVGTTISLASLAIIAVVGLILFREVKRLA
jgi:hypothetical protein